MSNIGLSNTYGIYTAMSNNFYTGVVGGINSGNVSSRGEPFRNLIINGGMVVDQRFIGNSNVITSNNVLAGPDRFFVNAVTTSFPSYSIQRLTLSDADNSVTQQNFSLRVTTTSNVTMTSPSNHVGVYHIIEGCMVAPLQWGTSNGNPASLSFYIKTNVTGTHCISFMNSKLTSSYVSPITIASADTYQKVTKTIPAPPSGTTWSTNSNPGIIIGFDSFGSGGIASANDRWLTGTYYTPTGGYASNLWTTSNNYIEITGVQFETGSNPTSFEYRQFSLELSLCQRYFESSYPDGIAPGTISPFSSPGNAIYMFGSNCSSSTRFTRTKAVPPVMTFYNPYTSNGNVATDAVYSSNLSVLSPSVTSFGVTSTDSNIQDRTIYFNWAAESDYLYSTPVGPILSPLLKVTLSNLDTYHKSVNYYTSSYITSVFNYTYDMVSSSNTILGVPYPVNSGIIDGSNDMFDTPGNVIVFDEISPPGVNSGGAVVYGTTSQSSNSGYYCAPTGYWPHMAFCYTGNNASRSLCIRVVGDAGSDGGATVTNSGLITYSTASGRFGDIYINNNYGAIDPTICSAWFTIKNSNWSSYTGTWTDARKTADSNQYNHYMMVSGCNFILGHALLSKYPTTAVTNTEAQNFITAWVQGMSSNIFQ